jgi:hypothetical protein
VSDAVATCHINVTALFFAIAGWDGIFPKGEAVPKAHKRSRTVRVHPPPSPQVVEAMKRAAIALGKLQQSWAPSGGASAHPKAYALKHHEEGPNGAAAFETACKDDPSRVVAPKKVGGFSSVTSVNSELDPFTAWLVLTYCHHFVHLDPIH